MKCVWRHSTLITPALTARSQSIAASNQKLPDSAVKSGSSWPETTDVSGETIRLSIILRSAVQFLHVMFLKDKQTLVFNVIFDL